MQGWLTHARRLVEACERAAPHGLPVVNVLVRPPPSTSGSPLRGGLPAARTELQGPLNERRRPHSRIVRVALSTENNRVRGIGRAWRERRRAAHLRKPVSFPAHAPVQR
jgi:hypothetical protein